MVLLIFNLSNKKPRKVVESIFQLLIYSSSQVTWVEIIFRARTPPYSLGTQRVIWAAEDSGL